MPLAQDDLTTTVSASADAAVANSRHATKFERARVAQREPELATFERLHPIQRMRRLDPRRRRDGRGGLWFAGLPRTRGYVADWPTTLCRPVGRTAESGRGASKDAQRRHRRDPLADQASARRINQTNGETEQPSDNCSRMPFRNWIARARCDDTDLPWWKLGNLEEAEVGNLGDEGGDRPRPARASLTISSESF